MSGSGSPTCSVLLGFAKEQLARGAAVTLEADTPVPTGRVLVCLAHGAVWWRTHPSERRHHTQDMQDRVLGSLQLFYQLLAGDEPIQPGCVWISVEDMPLDGDGSAAGATLSSHRRATVPQQPFTFMWPEFDYEARLVAFQPPLPTIQAAAWRRAAPWSQRSPQAYTRASLNIYHERRRVKACMKDASAMRRFLVQSMQWVVSPRTSSVLCALGSGEHDTRSFNVTCSPPWQWSPANWLDQYRRYQYALFLPGQQDWSTTFQLLMSVGSALLMPSDLRTHSLWTQVVTASCERCVLTYSRDGDVCASLRAALPPRNSSRKAPSVGSDRTRHDAPTGEEAATNLDRFVRTELRAECVNRCMDMAVTWT